MLSLFSLSSLTLLLSHNQATSLQHILAQSLTLNLSHPLRLTANRLSHSAARPVAAHTFNIFMHIYMSHLVVGIGPGSTAEQRFTNRYRGVEPESMPHQARSAHNSLAHHTSTAPLLTHTRLSSQLICKQIHKLWQNNRGLSFVVFKV
jgi:hypothetical protein